MIDIISSVLVVLALSLLYTVDNSLAFVDLHTICTFRIYLVFTLCALVSEINRGFTTGDFEFAALSLYRWLLHLGREIIAEMIENLSLPSFNTVCGLFSQLPLAKTSTYRILGKSSRRAPECCPLRAYKPKQYAIYKNTEDKYSTDEWYSLQHVNGIGIWDEHLQLESKKMVECQAKKSRIPRSALDQRVKDEYLHFNSPSSQ